MDDGLTPKLQWRVARVVNSTPETETAQTIGLAVPGLRFLYDYAWFVGFFVSAASYYLLMLRYKVNLLSPVENMMRSESEE